MAAGLTIEKSRLGDLRAFLGEALGGPVAAGREANGLAIDAALSARGATAELIDLVDQAGPYGAGHPEPVFVFPAHRLAYVEAAGNGHVRLSLASGDGATLRALLFRGAETELGRTFLSGRGRSLHVAGALSLDQWQGRAQASLRIIDAAEPAAP
jgi:single-stranded-DNA-specific exonuclease